MFHVFPSQNFLKIDFSSIQIGNRDRTQPNSASNRIDGKDVRASTLPRRRGDMGTSSENNPNRESPRTSTPSVDSAVGSAEGLGVHQNLNVNLEEIRPRSDGSDSLTTSSALTSPEPPINGIHTIPNNQQDFLSLGPVTKDQRTIDSINVETTIQKGWLLPNIIIFNQLNSIRKRKLMNDLQHFPSQTRY